MTATTLELARLVGASRAQTARNAVLTAAVGARKQVARNVIQTSERTNGRSKFILS